MKSTTVVTAFAVLLLLASCGGEDAAQADDAAQDAPRATYGSASKTQQPERSAGAEKAARPDQGTEARKAVSGKPLGSRTLAYPEDLQMIMLSYRLRGEAPPIETWAAEAQSVRMSNEFTRAAALKEEMDRLQGAYDSTADVGLIQMRTSTSFSQYDSNRGGYYITAFQPGTTYQFDAYREKVALQITNAGDAYFWPLDAAAAQEVLATNLNGRHIFLDATIALTGMERRSTGPHLTGEVLEFKIFGSNYAKEALLGERSVK